MHHLTAFPLPAPQSWSFIYELSGGGGGGGGEGPFDCRCVQEFAVSTNVLVPQWPSDCGE